MSAGTAGDGSGGDGSGACRSAGDGSGGGGSGGDRVHFSYDGRPMSALPGSTIAGALLANGVQAWRRTRGDGKPRGLFCGIGVCFDCLVEHNDRPAVRACVTALSEGDRIGSSGSLGRPSGP